MKKVMKAVAAIMLMTTVACIAGCTKSDEPNNGGNDNGGNNGGGNHSNHEYVDLGLPSGILWATCNIDAETPEGFGSYFAWGETTTKTTACDWSNYKYCNGSENTLTKYCDSANYGYNGYTDELVVLQPCDDAATAKWGSGWRMPTMGEWQELIQNTTSTWTKQNEVTGRLLTSENGNSIFLPTSGAWGGYWSRSLGTNRPCFASYFHFGSDYYGMDYYYRAWGLHVRPVRSAK